MEHIAPAFLHCPNPSTSLYIRLNMQTKCSWTCKRSGKCPHATSMQCHGVSLAPRLSSQVLKSQKTEAHVLPAWCRPHFRLILPHSEECCPCSYPAVTRPQQAQSLQARQKDMSCDAQACWEATVTQAPGAHTKPSCLMVPAQQQTS